MSQRTQQEGPRKGLLFLTAEYFVGLVVAVVDVHHAPERVVQGGGRGLGDARLIGLGTS
jgi:hypothetical protein